ncbi:hypothetical protein, partial [Thiolapillus sp.]
MFSLWRKARRENSAASRLLGSTSLRFALHGWQRMIRDVLYRAVGRVIHAEKIQCGLPRPVSSRPECKRATGIV